MTLLIRAATSAPLLLIAATLGWAGNTIAGKLAVVHVSPMLLTFMRWGLVVLMLSALLPRQIIAHRSLGYRHGGWMLFLGASITLFNGLFYWAAYYTSAINLSIIQSTIPAYILLGAFLMFGERVRRRALGGLLLTLAGALYVVSQGRWEVLAALTFNPGDLLMLAACLFYAAYTLGIRRRPAIGTFLMMWFIAVAAWIATIPLLLLEIAIGALQLPSADVWLPLIYIALVPSLLSQVFFIRGVDLIGAARAGLYVNLIPVFSSLMGVLILSETPHLYHFTSLGLVFGGIYLFEKNKNN